MPASTVTPAGSDKRNHDGISNYTKFWQKDSKNDSETDMANRLTEYTSVVNGAYDLLYLNVNEVDADFFHV